MLDASLQILAGSLATLAFTRRGDRSWLAAGKGTRISVICPTRLSIALAITAGPNWPRVWQRR